MSDTMTRDKSAPFGRDERGVPLDRQGTPANFGLKNDGTAAEKRGPKPTMPPPSKPKVAQAPAKGKMTPDEEARELRRNGLSEFVSAVAIPLAFAGMVNESFALDARTIEDNKAPLCEAVVDLAEKHPVVGTVVDKITKASPFGALIGAMLPIAMQIAENHSVKIKGVPISQMLPVVPRDQFKAQMEAEAEAMMAAHRAA